MARNRKRARKWFGRCPDGQMYMIHNGIMYKLLPTEENCFSFHSVAQSCNPADIREGEEETALWYCIEPDVKPFIDLLVMIGSLMTPPTKEEYEEVIDTLKQKIERLKHKYRDVDEHRNHLQKQLREVMQEKRTDHACPFMAVPQGRLWFMR